MRGRLSATDAQGACSTAEVSVSMTYSHMRIRFTGMRRAAVSSKLRMLRDQDMPQCLSRTMLHTPRA